MNQKDLEILVLLMVLEEITIIHAKILEIEAKNMIKESFTDITIKDRIDQIEMITMRLYLKLIKEMIHKKNLDFKINVDIIVHLEIKTIDFKKEEDNNKITEKVVILVTKKMNKDALIVKKKDILLEIAQSLIEIILTIGETEVEIWEIDKVIILKQIALTIELFMHFNIKNVEKLL